MEVPRRVSVPRAVAEASTEGFAGADASARGRKERDGYLNSHLQGFGAVLMFCSSAAVILMPDWLTIFHQRSRHPTLSPPTCAGLEHHGHAEAHRRLYCRVQVLVPLSGDDTGIPFWRASGSPVAIACQRFSQVFPSDPSRFIFILCKQTTYFGSRPKGFCPTHSTTWLELLRFVWARVVAFSRILNIHAQYIKSLMNKFVL